MQSCAENTHCRKTQGWKILDMLSAMGKLAATILASMENPRETLIAWEYHAKLGIRAFLRRLHGDAV
jgi:hypothetical protein